MNKRRTILITLVTLAVLAIGAIAVAGAARRLKGKSIIDYAYLTNMYLGGTQVTSTAAELNIMDGVTATTAELNTLDLSAQGFLVKTKTISISTTPTGTWEHDTGWDLPLSGSVMHVWLNVTVAEATGVSKTFSHGLLSTESGGDANGFAALIDVSTTGMKKGTLASGGQTLGALMYVDESGGGVLVPEAHVLNGTAKSVTYTATSNDWAEFEGTLYIVYSEFP